MANCTSPRDRRNRVRIDNVYFDAMTEAQVVQHVIDSLHAGTGGCIITPNIDILRQARTPALSELIAEADLVVPDGMPIIWASHAQGEPLPERVTGSSLARTISHAAANHNRSVFLLGGRDGTADKAAERLSVELPALRLAGTHCPPFGFDRDPLELATTMHTVVNQKPDIVFVALGFPKQEKLMMMLRQELPQAWLIGCGGALAMIAGQVSRAPAWAQRSGLEWAHRLALEPHRLARRYIVHGLPCAVKVLAGSLLKRASRSIVRCAR